MVGPEKNAISDYELVPTQRAPSGKIDINNAQVTDYKAAAHSIVVASECSLRSARLPLRVCLGMRGCL